MFASSNMHGDEDAAAENISNDGSQDDEETKFVEWDPTGRFGRVSVDLSEPSFSPTMPSPPSHPPPEKKEISRVTWLASSPLFLHYRTLSAPCDNCTMFHPNEYRFKSYTPSTSPRPLPPAHAWEVMEWEEEEGKSTEHNTRRGAHTSHYHIL